MLGAQNNHQCQTTSQNTFNSLFTLQFESIWFAIKFRSKILLIELLHENEEHCEFIESIFGYPSESKKDTEIFITENLYRTVSLKKFPET